jgi:hypothetical protein
MPPGTALPECLAANPRFTMFESVLWRTGSCLPTEFSKATNRAEIGSVRVIPQFKNNLRVWRPVFSLRALSRLARWRSPRLPNNDYSFGGSLAFKSVSKKSLRKKVLTLFGISE